ncbi:HWE histidine kinase domain-containing protein [Microvirga alba]|uniref:Blue-light-activated histidine kinase n=1 Tax=Microvirga alba TaxID=2791025 RepID=A0A931FNL8_9HYPH|nr:HWE histidine kinase domain-containing protein [Microvirga alba]MBF9233810.1 PAS domain-containing protein [Microvirga alba]
MLKAEYMNGSRSWWRFRPGAASPDEAMGRGPVEAQASAHSQGLVHAARVDGSGTRSAPDRTGSMLTRLTKIVPANSPIAIVIAIMCVVIATVARMSLAPLLGLTTPFITMFPAALAAALIGGIIPGLVAIVLGAISAWYFFIPHTFSFGAPSLESFVAVVFYVGVALLMVLAVGAMRSALARLEAVQEKLYAALAASKTGTWRWDMQSNVVEWDPATGELFQRDYRSAPRSLEEFLDIVHPDDRDAMVHVVSKAVRTGEVASYEFRAILPDGSIRWLYERSRAVCDADGRPLYMIGACVDITERKRAEERQVLLLHELNHRVKNTLTTVQSLASQTLRGSHSPEEFQITFLARLMALSATHDILTRTLWESAPLGEVIAAELKPHGGIDGQRISAFGDVVELKPQQALSLGMAFHELATNSAKYGALSTPQGSIKVSWIVKEETAGDRQLAILWHESGGPAVLQPERQGFGTRLIQRSITHELGGAVEMSYQRKGIECAMRLPLSAA